MGWKFNPFTGALDQTGSGGGGGAQYIDGEVATYSDLPLDGSAALNSAWLVREASGIWPVSRKQAGIYIRTATAGSSRDADYTYAGTMPDVFSDANFTLYDESDSTKNAKFQLSGIATGTTRTITVPNKNVTLDDAGDSRAPTPHASSHAAGVKAYFFGQTGGMTEDVFIRANNVGTTGNITLTFNGSTTIDSAISTWNSANPSNQVTLVSGEGSQTPDNGRSIELEHGVNAGSDPYQSVNATSLTVVGTSDTTPVAVIQGAQWFGSVNGNQGVLYQGDEDGKVKVIALNKAFNAYRSLELVSDGSGFGFPANGGTLVTSEELNAKDASSSNTATFNASGSLTANRIYDLPDASGTLALTSDIPALGTGGGEAAEGNHVHGNLTSDGKLGSTAGLPVVTTTAGAVTTLALGSAGQILRTKSDLSGVEFADPAASGVTGAAASASDVLGVSGANITGVDANADRIVYWNNTSNKLAYGTPADAGAAAASHTHTSADINSQTASNGHVLTANGSGGASFAALPASGISAVGASTADVFSVSGSDLVADDGGTIDSSDPFIKWDDTNSKLVYANPLSRPSGAFYVGLAPTTTALGTNSVNIQSGRDNAAHLAKDGSSVCVGYGARSTSSSAAAVGHNSSSGNSSAALGASATAGNDSVAVGASAAGGNLGVAIGRSADASSSSGGVAIGYLTAATGVYSVGIGYDQDVSLRGAFSVRPFNSIYWSGQTTTNAATILNLDGTATNRFTIAASTALAVDILLVARRATTQDKWLVARRFLGIRRDGSNNTALIGAVQTLGTDQSAGSPTWTFALTADDTNEALQLEVTGATGETVEWRATAFYRVA